MSKYSELKDKGNYQVASYAMKVLMAQGFVSMDAYAFNEVMNLIRALREIKVAYTMRSYYKEYLPKDAINRHSYEFSFAYFEDDRK